ncbi:GvpL/GvpF family gas vesicle protein [Streptomyces sp. CRN 30]|uniref:GvpL/GvpF family gas vesicle protein n=1 Tax=Streptomyces sp. CRN 30 TaxID=3075613 RepID=UPI002A831AA9|nr:GvpL/GvpF family gas vesicle protein [Streptomyces sp. CRN 30]
MSDQTALYVYALVRHAPGAADGVTGLDGRPLRLVRVPGTGFAALVHDASPAPFEGGDDQVRRWVDQQSRAVTAVWERVGSLLPMTFNVLVADEPPAADSPGGGGGGGRRAEQRLMDWLTERAPEITAQLDELTGRCELRVEITVDRTALAPQEASTPMGDTRLAARTAGMRRLLAKQREQNLRDAAGQLADTLHAEARHRLLSVAEDYRDRGRVHRAPDETDVLSAALLVRQEDIDTVGTVLTELGTRHPAVRIRFLGPWPPYSFTAENQGMGEAGAPGGAGSGAGADRAGTGGGL